MSTTARSTGRAQITLYIDAEAWEETKRQGARLKMSGSECVRLAMDQWLQRARRMKTRVKQGD